MLPGQPCHVNPTSATWTQTSPTGFFYGSKWHMIQCAGVSTVPEFRSCLTGRTLILFGDSTTRHWYTQILQMMKCKQTSTKWTFGKWHGPSVAVNPVINFKVKWLPHAYPFYTGDYRYITKSVVRNLDEIPSDENVIILLHMYAHFLTYHYFVFWDRVRRVRHSVQRLLQRNPKVVIAIKGPHTFANTFMDAARLNDYMGFLFADILRFEFSDIQDKVIYLDQRDITVAAESKDIHPDTTLIRQMVGTMFALVC
jgi:hypothetical protein